jgi:hypothetical protein
LAVTAAACGGGGTPPQAAPTTTSTAPQITTPTVTVNGKAVTVPHELGETRPIESAIDTGQDVIYTAKGFLPAFLFAAHGEPITFTNLTSEPLTLELPATEHANVTIAPGGSWSWVPDVLAFEYVAPNRDHGKAAVGAFDS